MKIERAPTLLGWAVEVSANELVVASGKPYPHRTTIGIVYDSGRISAWTPVGYKPHGYPKAAKRMLAQAAEKLVREGKVRWTRSLGQVLASYGIASGLYGQADPGLVSRARPGYFKKKDLVWRVLNASGRLLGTFPTRDEAIALGIRWTAEFKAPSFVQKYDDVKKVGLGEWQPAKMGD